VTPNQTGLQTIRVNFVRLMSEDCTEQLDIEAWRLSYWHQGEWKTLGTRTAIRRGFAREKDAAMAMEALVKAGLDTAEAALNNKRKVFATIAKAMAW
jgi:hypothetical protein